jgi:hypothetical protein
MKRLLKVLIVALLFVTLLPIKADAAKAKYIIKADVVYKIYQKEKITLYVDTTKKVTWSTSNKKVVTVSSKGVVTGKDLGNATITATVGKKKYKCKVEVWSKEEVIIYENDVAPADPADRYAATEAETTAPSTEPDNANSDLDGIESYYNGSASATETDTSTESDELITSDKIPEWADEYYLENVYGYSAYYFDKLYIVRGVNDTCVIANSITGTLEVGKIYVGNYNGFTVHFQIDKSYELSFNYADLKSAGIIK